MIDEAYLRRLGLNKDQIIILLDDLKRESQYRRILGSEHVTHIEDIMKQTDMNAIDLNNEPLLREKVRIEYDDLIPMYFKCQK